MQQKCHRVAKTTFEFKFLRNEKKKKEKTLGTSKTYINGIDSKQLNKRQKINFAKKKGTCTLDV